MIHRSSSDQPPSDHDLLTRIAKDISIIRFIIQAIVIIAVVGGISIIYQSS